MSKSNELRCYINENGCGLAISNCCVWAFRKGHGKNKKKVGRYFKPDNKTFGVLIDGGVVQFFVDGAALPDKITIPSKFKKGLRPAISIYHTNNDTEIRVKFNRRLKYVNAIHDFLVEKKKNEKHLSREDPTCGS